MLSVEIAQQLLLYLLLSQDEQFVPLAPREREIIVLCARGLTLPEIAQVLGISSQRVTRHVEHVLDALTIMDQVEDAMQDVLSDRP